MLFVHKLCRNYTATLQHVPWLPLFACNACKTLCHDTSDIVWTDSNYL